MVRGQCRPRPMGAPACALQQQITLGFLHPTWRDRGTGGQRDGVRQRQCCPLWRWPSEHQELDRAPALRCGLLCPAQDGHRIPAAATPGKRGCFQWDLWDRQHLSLFAVMEGESLASGARGTARCWPCCRGGWHRSGWWRTHRAPWAALQGMRMGRLGHAVHGTYRAVDCAGASCPAAASSSPPALWLRIFIPGSARSRRLSASEAQPSSCHLEVQLPVLVPSARGPCEEVVVQV